MIYEYYYPSELWLSFCMNTQTLQSRCLGSSLSAHERSAPAATLHFLDLETWTHIISVNHPSDKSSAELYSYTAAGSSTLNCCLDFSQRYCSVCCHPHETQDSILKNLINICSFITVANLFKIENLVYTFQIRKWALVPASRPPSSWRECT